MLHAFADHHQTAQRRREISPIIGGTLGISRLRSRRMAARVVREMAAATTRQLRLEQTTNIELKAQAERINFPRISQLAHYLDHSSRGLVITSLHMGDYLGAMLKLAGRLRVMRRVNICEHENERRPGAIFDEFEHRVRVIKTERRSPPQVVSGLRKGEIAVALADLPGRWGATTPVDFMGRTMDLVRGPATLAVAGRADLLILMCCESAAGPYAMALPILRGDDPSTPWRARIQQIAGYLAAQMDSHIRNHPEQWQHWYLIPEMLAASRRGPDCADASAVQARLVRLLADSNSG